MRRSALSRILPAVAIVLAGLALAMAPAQAGVAEKLRDGCRLLLGGRFQGGAQAFHEAGVQDA